MWHERDKSKTAGWDGGCCEKRIFSLSVPRLSKLGWCCEENEDEFMRGFLVGSWLFFQVMRGL
jgi:hypothetical protein